MKTVFDLSRDEIVALTDEEIRGQDKTGACVQHRPLHDFREIY